MIKFFIWAGLLSQIHLLFIFSPPPGDPGVAISGPKCNGHCGDGQQQGPGDEAHNWWGEGTIPSHGCQKPWWSWTVVQEQGEQHRNIPWTLPCIHPAMLVYTSSLKHRLVLYFTIFLQHFGWTFEGQYGNYFMDLQLPWCVWQYSNKSTGPPCGGVCALDCHVWYLVTLLAKIS